jgi:hypothetical protein
MNFVMGFHLVAMFKGSFAELTFAILSLKQFCLAWGYVAIPP